MRLRFSTSTGSFQMIVWMSLVNVLLAVSSRPLSRTSTSSPITSSTPKRPPQEMLLPLHSTTALRCDPLFSGSNLAATWYKDGKAVAKVTSNSNSVLRRSSRLPDAKVPEVGFLLISDIQLSDEGTYWCRRDDTNEAGEVVQLKVAFVAPMPKSNWITVMPTRPKINQPILLTCPFPQAVPKPTISWLMNGQPLTEVASDFIVFPNGSLLIQKASLSDFGLYECFVSNFASKQNTRLFLDPNEANTAIVEERSTFFDAYGRCGLLFRSSLLYFLLGCLVTSTGVLLYLVFAIFCVRATSSSRLVIRPSMFLRNGINLAPGFRKAVRPTPDFAMPPETQPL